MTLAKKRCSWTLITLLLLSGCSQEERDSSLHYEKVAFSDLPAWHQDSTHKALPAIQRSCQVILRKQPCTPMRTRPDGEEGDAQDWFPFCSDVSKAKTEENLRDLMHSHLTPYKLHYNGSAKAQVTGYYEPILRGSLKQHGPYQTPLYKMPPKRLSRQTRASIVKGGLRNKGLEIVYVDDPIDAFFLQIQGSGQVRLDNGQTLYLGYAGQNGCPYYPIGKTLKRHGMKNVSMQSIRAWLEANPEKAEDLMSENKSYVFFKRKPKGQKAVGAQGSVLLGRRSVAVDPAYVSLGTLMWVDLDHPSSLSKRLQHLVVAQDKGGAIKGALRADYFCGIGKEAAALSGRMNSHGHLYVILPK